MTYMVVGLPGDGIGPEVFAAMKQVVAATGVPIEWREVELGLAGGGLNPVAIDEIEQYKVAIKGPTGTPLGEGHRSYNVLLREAFDLFANVRPVRTIPGLLRPGVREGVDLVIFRENLEDLYKGQEFEIPGGFAAISQITSLNTEELAHFAASYMQQHGRSEAVVGAKSNILKKTHGLFAEVSLDALRRFKIPAKQVLPDALAAQLVQWPEAFDCIVLPNFLGDLFSDLCAAFMGGLGVAPGANFGDEVAVFEAVHGTAPDIAGKGIANPTALVLSAAMMLDHLEEGEAAQQIRDAIDAVYTAGEYLTGDVVREGATAVTTAVFTEALCGEVRRIAVEAA